MRAITLHQPWASLIAGGYKTTETRGWPAPESLVGSRIAIHAAKRTSRPSEWNAQVGDIASGLEFPLGAIVATARLDGCVRVLSGGFASLEVKADPGRVWVVDRSGEERSDAYRMDSDPYGGYSEGRWIWLLSGVRPVNPPIEARGRQGMWKLPLSLSDPNTSVHSSNGRLIVTRTEPLSLIATVKGGVAGASPMVAPYPRG